MIWSRFLKNNPQL